MATERRPLTRSSITTEWPTGPFFGTLLELHLMAAPPFVPVDPVDRPRTYGSPAHVPSAWSGARPGAVVGRQPDGPSLGYQGPDQGYALLLSERVRDRVQVRQGERVDDALAGCLVVALRRASSFGRAPVIHDLTVALTIWGFFDPAPPPDLVALRRQLFEGVANVSHHYAEGRAIAEAVPAATLRMAVSDVTTAYPALWRSLLGV